MERTRALLVLLFAVTSALACADKDKLVQDAARGGASSVDGGKSGAENGGKTSAGTSSGGKSAAGGKSSAGSSATGDVLDRLGVKKSEVPLSDSSVHHPLQQAFSTYRKRSELYLAGASYFPDAYFSKSSVNVSRSSDIHQFLLDDKSAVDAVAAPKGYRPLYTSSGDQLWTTYPSASTAANLRGDGVEVVMVLYRNPTSGETYLRMIRRGSGALGSYEEKEYPLGKFDLVPNSEYPTHNKLQVAAGDLDGDGTDELALAIGGTLAIEKYSRDKDSFSELAKRTMSTDVGRHQTSVAIGNVDDEPGLEVVVADGTYSAANSCAYYVFEVKQGALQLKAGGPSTVVMEAPGQPGRTGFRIARVAIGDLNADGMNEIIFGGDADINQLMLSVMQFQPKTRGYDVIASKRMTPNWEGQYLPVLAVFNPEGTVNQFGKFVAPKELLFHRYILHLNSDGTLTERWPGLLVGSAWHDKVTVGDFSGQGKDYLAFYSPDSGSTLQVWGYESSAFHQIDSIDVDPATDASAATICAVNIDDDSTIVKYSQSYEMLYSEPQLVAVLAFPPYYEGQDVSNAYTAFGWQQTSDNTDASTLGVYAGFSVGYSFSTPFWGSAGSSEFKLNVDTSLDFTSSTTNSWSGTAKKTCIGGDAGGTPCVVFSYVPIDVYYYEVVESPDKTQIGKVLSVQIPRSPRIADTTLAQYNSLVAANLEVPTTIADELTTQLGHPERYPNRAQMMERYAAAPGAIRTADGLLLEVSANSTATNDFELTAGTSASVGNEFNLQVGIEVETVSGGVLVGGRAGFHYGYSQSSSVGRSTIIEGGVPGISSSVTGAPYNVGLFAYKQKRADGGDFVVVDYWVEQ